MPPAKEIEATVYLLDGAMKDTNEMKMNLLNIFINCKKRGVKSTGVSSDIASIIFYNSAKGRIPGYDCLEMAMEWQDYMLSALNDIFKESRCGDGNLIDGLDYASQYLQEVEKLFVTKIKLCRRIVLISNFQYPIHITPKLEKKMLSLKQKFKDDDIWLYILGPQTQIPFVTCREDIEELKFTPPANASKQEANNYKAVCTIIHKGVIADYITGYHLMFSYRKAEKSPYPWYANIEIGNNLRYKVCLYKAVREPLRLKLEEATKSEDIKTESSIWVEKGSHNSVDNCDVISVYKFQDKIVQFTPEQEDQMKKLDTARSLQIIAFVKAEQLNQLYYVKGSLHVLTADPRTEDGSAVFLKGFCEEMITKKVVALALRVYNTGNKPNWFVVYPCPEHKSKCILMSQLPARHDLYDRCDKFIKPVKGKVGDSSEFKEAVFNFLKDMTVKNEDIGSAVSPLSFNLQQDPYDMYLQQKACSVEFGLLESTEKSFEPHEILKERSRKSASALEKLLLQRMETSKQDDNEFQLKSFD